MSAQGRGQYMKRVNIGVVFVLALASTSLVARPQTKDVKGPTIGNAQKSPRLRQVGDYPTMLNMTFPEFAAATAKTDTALLPIGSIEEPWSQSAACDRFDSRGSTTHRYPTLLANCQN